MKSYMKYFLLIAGSLVAGIAVAGVLICMGAKTMDAATMGFCVFGALSCFGYSHMLTWTKCPFCKSKIRARSLQCPSCKKVLTGYDGEHGADNAGKENRE